ncbi:GNAT family N-acetyltransferase [Hymenobacter sp. UYP22]|uniref:GNAT family N-acetyltransferase n=1 Tax=Hymenobacter sp. UYP22 TaxID=3156348 RepID=UPI0033997381
MKPVISLFWSQIDVDKPNTVYIQARFPGGATVAQLCLDVEDSAGWIRAVYVQEAYQGRGLGSLLLGRAFAVCRALHFESVGLTVHHENRKARTLYQRLGFMRFLDGHENYQQYIKPL